MSHNLKINGVEYSAVDKLLIPNVNGEDVEFIVPGGSVNITTNGSHSVSGKATANVNVSAYVYYNTYSPTSDLQTLSIDLGFVPKGVAIITGTSIHRVTNYSYISAWVWENTTGTVRQRVNYVCSTSASSSNTGVTQGAGTGSFPSSISGTKFTWNLASSTATAYNFRFKSGVTYYIFAWG